MLCHEWSSGCCTFSLGSSRSPILSPSAGIWPRHPYWYFGDDLSAVLHGDSQKGEAVQFCEESMRQWPPQLHTRVWV